MGWGLACTGNSSVAVVVVVVVVVVAPGGVEGVKITKLRCCLKKNMRTVRIAHVSQRKIRDSEKGRRGIGKNVEECSSQNEVPYSGKCVHIL